MSDKMKQSVSIEDVLTEKVKKQLDDSRKEKTEKDKEEKKNA